MEAIRPRWTDERLADLKLSVDEGFREVKGSIDRLQLTMVVVAISMCTMMFAGFGALITLFATRF